MYFDTSTLVKRYVSEVGSHWVRIILALSSQNVVYASALAQPEVLSALQRKVREAQLAQVDPHRLARRGTSHFAWRYRLLAITPGVVPRRVRLCKHILCAPMMRSIWRVHWRSTSGCSSMEGRCCILWQRMRPCWLRPQRKD